jgi:hypothetical protein
MKNEGAIGIRLVAFIWNGRNSNENQGRTNWIGSTGDGSDSWQQSELILRPILVHLRLGFGKWIVGSMAGYQRGWGTKGLTSGAT